jgi:hypothetical protein
LVNRLTRSQVRAFGSLWQHAVQPATVGSGVYAAALVRAHHAVVAQPADHDHLVFVGSQWLENRRDFKTFSATADWMEVREKHAVGGVDKPKPLHRRGSGTGCGRRQRRRHGIEKRKGNRRPQAAENRTSGQRFLGDDHLVISYSKTDSYWLHRE